MTDFIALLRGVNVGGKAPLPMDALRASLADAGFTGVRTLLQSGNVILGSKTRAPDALEAKLRRVILQDFGLDVVVLVRSPDELDRILAANPFLRERGVDPAHLHVSFLPETPKKTALAALGALKAGKDRALCIGREVYLHTPDGYGRTKLTTTALERALGLSVTTRNWNTVGKLAALARQSGTATA